MEMKKLNSGIAIICFSICFVASALADDSDDLKFKSEAFPVKFDELWYEEHRFPHLFALSLGPVFSSDVGESQNFPIQNPETDSFYNYQKTSQVETNGQFALFIGDRWVLRYPWKFEAGIAYSQTGSMSSTGQLTQGADLLSEDTYSYRFKIQSRQLEAKGKFYYDNSTRILPYFSLGMGMAFNTASEFSTDVPDFLTLTRNFPSSTQGSYTYTLGLGAEYVYDEHIHLGLGYEFSDCGNVSFGSSNVSGASVPGTITQSHLYTHSIMAQISYLFDNSYHSTLKKLTDWS